MGSSSSVQQDGSPTDFFNGQDPEFQSSVIDSVSSMVFKCSKFKSPEYKNFSDIIIYDIFSIYKRLTTEKTQTDVIKNVLIPIICDNIKPEEQLFEKIYGLFNFELKKSQYFIETFANRENSIQIEKPKEKIIVPSLIWRDVYNLRDIKSLDEIKQFLEYMEKIQNICLNYATVAENSQICKFVHNISSSNKSTSLIIPAIKWGILTGDISLLLKLCSFGFQSQKIKIDKMPFPTPKYICTFVNSEKETGRFLVEQCNLLVSNSSIVATSTSIIILNRQSKDQLIEMNFSKSTASERISCIEMPNYTKFIVSIGDRFIIGCIHDTFIFGTLDPLRIDKVCKIRLRKSLMIPLCSDGRFIYSLYNYYTIFVFEIKDFNINYVREISLNKVIAKKDVKNAVLITDGIVIQIIMYLSKTENGYLHSIRTISAWNGSLISDELVNLNYIINAATFEPLTRTVWTASKLSEGYGLVRYQYEGPDSPVLTGFTIQKTHLSVLSSGIDFSSSGLECRIPAAFDNLIAPILGADIKAAGFNKDVYAMFQHGTSEDVIEALIHFYEMYLSSDKRAEYANCIWTCLACISMFARTEKLAVDSVSVEKLCFLLRRVADEEQFKQSVLYTCTQIFEQFFRPHPKLTAPMFTYLCVNSTPFQVQFLLSRLSRSKLFPLLISSSRIADFVELVVKGQYHTFLFLEASVEVAFREMLDQNPSDEIRNTAYSLTDSIINAVINNIEVLKNNNSYLKKLFDELLFYLKAGYGNYRFVVDILPILMNLLNVVNKEFDYDLNLFTDMGEFSLLPICVVDVLVTVVMAITSIAEQKIPISEISYLIFKSVQIEAVKPTVKIEDVYAVSKNIMNKRMKADEKEIELRIFTALSHHLSTSIEKSELIVKKLYKIRGDLRTSKQKTSEYNNSNKERDPELIENYDSYLNIMNQKINFLLTRTPFFSSFSEKNLELISQFLTNGVSLDVYIDELKVLEWMKLAISESLKVFQQTTRIQFFSKALNAAVFGSMVSERKIVKIIDLFTKLNQGTIYPIIQNICEDMFRIITGIPTSQAIAFTSLMVIIAMENYGDEAWNLMGSLFESIVLSNVTFSPTNFNALLTVACCVQKSFINNLGPVPQNIIRQELAAIELLPPHANLSMSIAASLMMAGLPNDMMIEVSILLTLVDAEDIHSFCNFMYELLLKNEKEDLIAIYDMCLSIIGSIICGNNSPLLSNYAIPEEVGVNRVSKVKTPATLIMAVVELAQMMKRILPKSKQLQNTFASILQRPDSQGVKTHIRKLAAVLFILSNSIIIPLQSGVVTDRSQPYLIREVNDKSSSLSVVTIPITPDSTSTVIMMGPNLKYDTLIRFNPSHFKMTDILIPIFKQSLMPSTTHFASIVNFFAMASLRDYISDVDTGEEFSRMVTSVLGSKLNSFQFRRFGDTAISLIHKSLNSHGDGVFAISHKVARMEHASYVDLNKQSMFVPSETSFITKSGYHVYMSTVLDPQNRTYFSIQRSKSKNAIIGITTLSLDLSQVMSLEYHNSNAQFLFNNLLILKETSQFNTIEIMFDPKKKKACVAVDNVHHRLLRVNFPEAFVCFFAIVPPFMEVPYRLAMTPVTGNFKKSLHIGLMFHPVKAFKRIISGPVKDVEDGSQDFRLLRDHNEDKHGEEIVRIIWRTQKPTELKDYVTIKNPPPFYSATDIQMGYPMYFKPSSRPTILSTMERSRQCVEVDTYGNISYPMWDNKQMIELDSIPAIYFKNMTKLPQDVINTLFSGVVERHRIENLTLLMARSVTTSLSDAIKQFGLELRVINLYLMNVALLFEEVSYEEIPSRQLPLQMSANIFAEGNTCNNSELFDHWNAARIIYNSVKESMLDNFIESLAYMVNERFNDPAQHFIKSTNFAAIGSNKRVELTNENASGFLVCKQSFQSSFNPIFINENFYYNYYHGQRILYTSYESFVILPITKSDGNTILFGTFIELAVWWKYLVLLISENSNRIKSKLLDTVKFITRKILYWSIIFQSPFFAQHMMELLGFIDRQLPPPQSLHKLIDDIMPVIKGDFNSYIVEQKDIIESMSVIYMQKYYSLFGGDTYLKDEGDFIVPPPSITSNSTETFNHVKRVLAPCMQVSNFPFYLLLHEWTASMAFLPPVSLEIVENNSLKITFTAYIPENILIITDEEGECPKVKVTTGGRTYQAKQSDGISVSGPNIMVEYPSDISNLKFVIVGTDRPSGSEMKRIANINRKIFEEDVKRWMTFSERNDQNILSRITFNDVNSSIEIRSTLLKLTELSFPLHFLHLRMIFLFEFNKFISRNNVLKGQEMAAFARYATVRDMSLRFRNELKATENNTRLELKIYRQKGHDVRNGVTNRISDSMIAQLARAYNDPKMYLRSSLDPFHVAYYGENGIDCGGLSRDFMNELVRDIASERIGLFIMTPNARNRVGEFQDCIVPAPQSGTKYRHLYETVGALLAVAVRSGFVQTFSFPPIFWKYLADGQISIADVFEIDTQYKELIDSLTCDMTSEEFDERFNIWNTVKNISGVEKRLNMDRRRVTKATVQRYISSANALRIEELILPLQWIRHGFWTSLGIMKPPYVSASMLEYMACGDRTIDLQRLFKLIDFRRITKTERRNLMWVLSRFDDAHRRMFIQFATGTSSIPINAVFPFMTIERGINNDAMLPTAHTCFFRLNLPYYSSRDVMYRRILTAIEYGGSFEFS